MDSSDDEGIIVKQKSLRAKVLDSDDDNSDEGQPKLGFTLLKKNDLYDAEESDDEKSDHHNTEAISDVKKFTRVKVLDTEPSFTYLKKSDLYDAEESDDDDDSNLHNAEDILETQKSVRSESNEEKRHSFNLLKNNDLYDADESGDDEKNDYQNLEDISEIQKAYKSNKRSQSERKSKAKAVQQIHSESQRLVRESRVSLPYHRPRQRSLAEFLQRRQSVPSSVKLSSEDIGQVWKQLEERVKDAEQFYKSDSEEESVEVHTSNIDTVNSTNNNIENAIEIVNNGINNETGIINENVENATNNESFVFDKPENETPSVINNTTCNSTVENTVEEGKYDNATKTDVVIDIVSKENVGFHLDANKLENNKKSDNVAKKAVSNIFVTDDNACVDSDVFKVDNTALDQVETDTNVQMKATENSCDFHLHYSESQSVDTQVPWYENIQPPSPVSEEERVADREENIVNKENINEEKIMTEEEDSLSDRRLKKLARRSLPGLGDIAKLKPRLSGAPDDVIELEGEETSGNSGVLQLMQRFIKHSVPKRPCKKKEQVEIGIVRIDSEDIVQKDIVSVTLNGDEHEDDPKLAKPGAKLQKLKEQLQQQISKRRAEECSRRVQEKKEENEELSDCGMFDDADEMEENIATESETEEEEEEEEDVLPLVEKKRVKSAFVDDEADVSDDYEPSADEDESADDSGVDDRTISNSVENTQSSDKLKHEILVDSCNKSQSETQENSGMEKSQRTELERTKTFDLFMTQDYDYGIPPYQRPTTQRQDTVIEQEQRKLLEQESTVSFTETQSEDLSLMEQRTPVKLFGKTDTLSTEENMNMSSENVKNLVDSERSLSHADLESELVGLCSGKFSTQASNILQATIPCSGEFSKNVKALVDSDRDISHTDLEAELVGLCSGKFSTQLDNRSQVMDLCSGEISKNVKALVDSDRDVSRTNLESELVGLCSGKFSTQIDNTSQVTNAEDVHSESFHKHEAKEDDDVSLKIISDDDDDDEDEDVLQKRTRTRQKQLHFSDEESEAESDTTERIVEYDSEENEIPRGQGAKDFFENEAELSESEWGSADEDEQGLDTFEWEEGDAENLDQHQLKEQLNKIHMRRQMDEDRREVRLLQEILLEDGELHSEGGGRERKFRWKNIDNVDDSNFPRQDSDNEAGGDGDIEDEEQWRRARHEREMFLEKLKKEQPDPLVEEDSQLFKLGQAALKRMNSQDMVHPLKRSVSDISPDPKHPYKLLTKRGSFLARGDSALAKIAKLAVESSGGPISGPKNSRNFVFATISPEKKTGQTEVVQGKKKRMAPPGSTPPVVKKPRFGDKHTRGRGLLDLLNQ